MYDLEVKIEMTKLAVLLAKADIPFELASFTICGEPTIQIASPSKESCIIDAVCHNFSYGGKEGLLEIMGPEVDDYDDVCGWLTAEQAFKHFERVMKK